MAKLAYVCLNKGRWNDKQLISEEYITELHPGKSTTHLPIETDMDIRYGWKARTALLSELWAHNCALLSDKDLIFA